MSTDNPATKINENLAYARKARGFSSPTQFAEACGIAQRTYAGHESGENDPRASYLMLYSKVLNTPLHFLLWGGDLESNSALDTQINLEALKAEIDTNLKKAAIRLEAARRAKGLMSRSEFSRESGVSRTSIYTHEMNGQKLGSAFVLAYCNALDIDVDWLLWGQGNPLAHKPLTEQDTAFFDISYKYVNGLRGTTSLKS